MASGKRAVAVGAMGVAIFQSAAMGQAGHSDVQLLVEENRVVTGLVDLDQPGNPVLPGVRVFWKNLGEGFTPFFTDDPGYNASAGTFPQGTLIGFNIVDALRKWDPQSGDFETVPPESMLINLSTATRTTPPTPGGFVAGFNFAAVGASGGVHQHLNYFLNSPQSDGVYRLSLEITASGGIQNSEPIYILFNQGDGEANELEGAIAYMQAFVSPPGCDGDADGSGTVDVDDLTFVILRLGAAAPEDDGADVDGSGIVDVDDLTYVILRLGGC